MRHFPQFLLLALALYVLSHSPSEAAEPPAYDAVRDAYEQANLAKNLRWILERERLAAQRPSRVGVYADAGVWHRGLRDIVDGLEQQNVPCRLLDRTLLTREILSTFDAVVLPGGWAPLQWESAGEQGLANLKSYVDSGGRCIGVCAGAYLLAQDVRYEGETYRYPLGLFDGVAEGPVKGLAAYPQSGSVQLTPTDAGKKRGLAVLRGKDIYYSGGPLFTGGTKIEVLCRYPDGSAAAISRRVGQGEIVLIGVHTEIKTPFDAEAEGASGLSGKVYRALCQIKESPER